MINVALDGMGGDNAPLEIVMGAVKAVNANSNIKVSIFGDETLIKDVLSQCTYNQEQIDVIHTSETIDMAEHPVNAIKRKTDSSIVVALRQLSEGKFDAFVSAGSTGAVLVGGQLLVGRVNGIKRTPIAAIFPTINKNVMLIDSGANIDANATNLLQYAIMGTIYLRDVMGIDNPKVGIVNVGVEEEKGNALVREAFPLLKENKDINFIGSVEARDIPNCEADIIVCDAFVGNVILKLYEGTAMSLIKLVKNSFMSNLRSKIGGLLVKPALKNSIISLSLSNFGGAPLLGLKSLVLKTHGSSKREEISNTILQCESLVNNKLTEKIKDAIEKITIRRNDYE